MSHALDPLLRPRSIAFVGASPKPHTVGNGIIRQARAGGFAGAMVAVNPNYETVEGLACLPSLDALPAPVDLAILAVGNPRLEAQLDAVIAGAARAAVIFASGYLPEDREPPLLERLAAKARAAALPVCGGNCMGFFNLADGVRACGYILGEDVRAGPVAFLSHSGSAFGALMDCERRLGFSLVVSAGQEITTTVAEYMDFALTLAETRVIALFIETVREPAGFVAALEAAAARDVPVVALKVGRSARGAALARSHSGAIAGSDAAFEALCERHGVLRVATLDELVATAALLSQPRRAGPGGLAAIHDSGGERALLVDLAEAAEVPFARIGTATTACLAARLEHGLPPVNPCDAWGTLKDFPAVIEDCFEALLADDDSALGVVFADIRTGRVIGETYGEICTRIAARATKPIALATNVTVARHADLARRIAEAGVPVIDGTREALIAVRGALAYRDFRARPPLAPPPPPAPDVIGRWRSRLARGGALGEVEALSLLADFGVPTVAARAAEDREGALAAAATIGYPVALKTAMPGIDHKTDAGGVVLGIADAPAFARAYDGLAERLGPRVTVAAMAPAGVEVAFGLTVDPQFGPLVVIAAGGALIELLADRRVALPPLDTAAARRAIAGLGLHRLLAGVRGRPAADLDALAEAAARFSLLATTLGDRLAEVDVNPVIAGPEGCLAVDALIVAR